MLVVIRGDCNSKWEEACGYENDVVIYTMSYPSYEAELTKGNVLPYDDLDAQYAVSEYIQDIDDPCPELLPYFKDNPEMCALYAMEIVCAPCKDLEPTIDKCLQSSIEYAVCFDMRSERIQSIIKLFGHDHKDYALRLMYENHFGAITKRKKRRSKKKKNTESNNDIVYSMCPHEAMYERLHNTRIDGSSLSFYCI